MNSLQWLLSLKCADSTPFFFLIHFFFDYFFKIHSTQTQHASDLGGDFIPVKAQFLSAKLSS